MTKTNSPLSQQIDDMRARLTENARNEQALLRALADALGQADQQLLNEVRHVTAEHEARRVGILSELHVLASRLCVFPKPIPAEHITDQQTPAGAVNVLMSQVHEARATPRNGKTRHAPGDWRQAASNIDEELDFYLDAKAIGA